MTEIHLVSDFNTDVLGRYLAADKTLPVYSVVKAPFGQLFQSLQSPSSAAVGVVWARPEGVSPYYAALLDGEEVDLDVILAEVEQFGGLIRHFAKTKAHVLVATLVPSRNDRGLGMLDWSLDGPAYALARMNARLAEVLAGTRGVHLLDAGRWLEAGLGSPRSAKHWFALKCPFTEPVCQAAARDIKAALRGALGQGRKLVVVDLDDTLWGGVVGEVGWQKLRLGGHDHVGEAFVDFQKALKALTRRGIQVALVSKNDEAVALEAIDNHPAMVLGRGDLAGWRINWTDKARNLAELVAELNLGLQSVVFIDDNPAERGRVREALPEVLVPDWPKDPALYGDALRRLDCFEQAAITAEDRNRTGMYVEERGRKDAIAAFTSLDDWLLSLEIKVEVAALDDANLKRSVQLLNKTNQLNLRTRRLSESELLSWVSGGESRQVVTVSVADRFGDLGLTGLISWERRGNDLEIADYLLSCRAMGRQVEQYMLHLAVEAARAAGAGRVVAEAIPTERNHPCLDFWRQSGFAEAEPNLFIWDAARPYAKPAAIPSEP